MDGARLGEEARREDRGVVREDDHARQAVQVDVPAGSKKVREVKKETEREGGENDVVGEESEGQIYEAFGASERTEALTRGCCGRIHLSKYRPKHLCAT